jgi:hypothetical protein
MTRKRFVKLLMSEGYSRNEANSIAADARIRGLAYSTAYKAVQVTHDAGINLTDIDIDAVCDAIRKVAEAAMKIASALANAFCAFSETFNKEMEVPYERL